MSAAPILSLDGFGVTFGQDIVLADVHLRVPRLGVFNLVGPAGTGKSSLIRTLAGLNDAQPAMRTWGMVFIDNEPLSMKRRRRSRDNYSVEGQGGGARRIALVIQDARFLTASVRENLASGLHNRSTLTKAEQNTRLCDNLRENGLDELIELLDEDAITLSLGLQRRLAVVRAALAEPPIICVDEGTAGLDESEATEFLALLAKQAKERAVLFVTHNQSHARTLGGQTALLAGGRVQEQRATEEFFTDPRSEAAATFVRTGSCTVAGPNARKEDLAESVTPPPPLPISAQAIVASRYVGPSGFYWLKPGKLGGLPRPGIVATLDNDLAGLKRLGVNVLVTLEEKQTVSMRSCKLVGIHNHFFPITDMKVPSFEQADALCTEIDERIRKGDVVAMHCRAGLGRTGTMLAAQLVWDGISPLEAFETVRSINPSFIQSVMQIDFLTAYSHWLDDRREGHRESI